MGAFSSKRKSSKSRERRNSSVKSLAGKMRLLQEEINGVMYEREKEGRAYERQVMIFSFKEAEWKMERKKLKEEVKRLRKTVEEKEEKIREMEDHHHGALQMQQVAGEKCLCDKGWPLLGTSFLVEQMREERARRDEAVEKWKQLYLAIKTELDDLIQRTNGDVLCWRDGEEEEEMVEELKKELKSKEETIEALTERLASMERESYEKEREIDILRQSLRIISSTKKASHASTSLSQYF